MRDPVLVLLVSPVKTGLAFQEMIPMGLQIGRKDGEEILLHINEKTVKLTIRISQGVLRIYQGKRRKAIMEVGDIETIAVPCGFEVQVEFNSGYDSCQITLTASQEVVIRRDDYIG